MVIQRFFEACSALGYLKAVVDFMKDVYMLLVWIQGVRYPCGWHTRYCYSASSYC